MTATLVEERRAMQNRTILSCALLCLALSPGLAAAGGEAEALNDTKATARTLADEGYKLYESGRYDEAIEAFLEADRYYHAPTILLHAARCYEKLGKRALAVALYRRIAEEPLPADAPPAFLDAQREAQAASALLTSRVPRLRIVPTGAPVDQLQVTIDGAVVALSATGVTLQTPGRHTVHVSAPGCEPVLTEVDLREGQNIDLPVMLRRPPDRPAPRATIPPAARADEPLGWPVAIAFGAGGVSLGVGAVTGIMALGQSRDDDGSTLETASIASFVVSGVALGTGAVLVLTAPSPEKPAQARVIARPAWISFEGTF